MKILFAIKGLDNIQGGAERVLADISSGFSEDGHDVAVLSFDKVGGQSFYPLNPNIKRICLGLGNVHKRATIIETLVRMKTLRNTIKAEEPDIVIAYMHSMFIPISFSLAGTKIPVIASEHIVPEHYKTRKFEYALLMLSSFFVRKITVLSKQVKATYPSFMHKKMICIANPVKAPVNYADPIGKNDKKKVILNVGRLDPQKDQKTLISAFAKLAERYPDWNLRIIGEGRLRDSLEKQIISLGVESQVVLPGVTSDISSEYRRAHIFVLSSLYESFGLATAEAMSHGLPVIGFSDCLGTNELIVHEENGLSISGNLNGRVESLCQALEKLIQSPEQRRQLGENGLQVVQNFSSEQIMGEWSACIAESLKS